MTNQRPPSSCCCCCCSQTTRGKAAGQPARQHNGADTGSGGEAGQPCCRPCIAHLLTWAVPTKKISAPLLRLRRKVDVLDSMAVEPLPPSPALLLKGRQRAGRPSCSRAAAASNEHPWYWACEAHGGAGTARHRSCYWGLAAAAAAAGAVAALELCGKAMRQVGLRPGTFWINAPLTTAPTESRRVQAAAAAAPPGTARRAAIAVATATDARSIWGAGDLKDALQPAAFRARSLRRFHAPPSCSSAERSEIGQ